MDPQLKSIFDQLSTVLSSMPDQAAQGDIAKLQKMLDGVKDDNALAASEVARTIDLTARDCALSKVLIREGLTTYEEIEALANEFKPLLSQILEAGQLMRIYGPGIRFNASKYQQAGERLQVLSRSIIVKMGGDGIIYDQKVQRLAKTAKRKNNGK